MDFDKLSNRYLGDTAGRYDARRERTAKWDGEHAEIVKFLSGLRRESTVVDIPVGTGRFVELYAEYGLRATGFDVSPDMLAQAREKAAKVGVTMDLRIGDIRHIPLDDAGVDTVVCFRFLNWVNYDGFRTALGELARIARTNLLVTVRYYTPLLDFDRNVSGARRLARQVVRRVRKRYGKPGLVFHEKREVLGAFEALRLEVVSATCLERRADGTDYYVFQLRKPR